MKHQKEKDTNANHAREIARIGQLEHNVEVVVVDERAQVLYDIGVVELLEELDLLVALLATLLVHELVDFHFLEGDHAIVAQAARLEHLRELTLAYLLLGLEVLQPPVQVLSTVDLAHVISIVVVAHHHHVS